MKLVILDRDGTINSDSDDFVKTPEEWTPLPGALEAIARLNQAGWHVVIASNQSGLGRGLFDVASLNAMHAKMHKMLAAVGGRVDAIFTARTALKKAVIAANLCLVCSSRLAVGLALRSKACHRLVIQPATCKRAALQVASRIWSSPASRCNIAAVASPTACRWVRAFIPIWRRSATTCWNAVQTALNPLAKCYINNMLYKQ